MRMQLAAFRLDDQMYGVDVASVQEVLRLHASTHVPLTPPTMPALINLRGQVLRTIQLRERLGLTPRPEGVEPIVVVIRVAGDPVGLLVDSICGVVEVDADEFVAPPDALTGPNRDLIVGAYQLDDHLLLSLDVNCAVAA